MNQLDFPLLTTLVALPALGAAFVALLPKSRPELAKLVGVTISSVVGALTIYLLFEFDKANSGYQFVSQHQWISAFGISWKLGVDGISLFLVVLTGILFPLAILGPKIKHDTKAFVAWLLFLEAGCLGSFLALDLFLFFVCFESVLVPMYFIIGGWGYDNRVYAALKFFLFTLAGSGLMLVGIVSLAVLASRGHHLTFDVQLVQQHMALSRSTARWIFLAFALGFAVKVPLFPLHTWLPDAHTEAPTAGSVLLAGLMLKLGTYGLIRFCLGLFPEASRYFAPLFLTVGVIGIIYGALVATVQKDLKRLVAYSSIAHLGFIVLGTFALNRQCI